MRRGRQRSAAGLAALVVVLLAAPAAGQFAHQGPVPAHALWAGWLPETVAEDPATSLILMPSITTGADGRLYVAYLQAPPCPGFFVAIRDAGGWQSHALPAPSSGGCPQSGQRALAVATDGSVVVGVAASFSRFIGVYEGTPGTWTYTQLDAGPTGSSMSLPAVAIAPDGTVHVSFWRKGTTIGEVKHAWRDANGWHLEVIGQTMRAMTSYTSMAAAPDGTLQVFYAKDQTSPPVYAENDGTGWVLEDLPASFDPAGRFSATQTPHGRPMVAAQESFDIRFIWRDTNDAWQTKLLAAGIFVSPSLAVASDGRPHVVYSELDHSLVGPVFDYRSGKPSYATPLDVANLAGSWVTEHIGIPGDHDSLETSIAVDSTDRPNISAIVRWTGGPNPSNPAFELPIPETLRVYRPVT